MINDEGISQNRPLINSLFSSEIACNIVSIPINNSQHEDRLFWKHTKDGSYYVKSGYWVAKRLKDASSSNPSSSFNNHHQWSWLPALNIQLKLKLFTWRCMIGILQAKQIFLLGVHRFTQFARGVETKRRHWSIFSTIVHGVPSTRRQVCCGFLIMISLPTPFAELDSVIHQI